MRRVAEAIRLVLMDGSEAAVTSAANIVHELTEAHPLYRD